MRKEAGQGPVVDGWSELQRRLAEVLAAMGAGGWQYLIVEDRETGRFVQFAVEARSALRAEAVSNDYLGKEDALSDPACQTLATLGWTPPPARTEEADPAPQNFLRVFERPVDFQEVARLGVRTLRDVFQALLPARLHYEAFARGGGALVLPTLGLSRRPPRPPAAPKPETLESMQEKVLAALRDASGVATLAPDEDGDLCVPYGSAWLHVRTFEKPPFVRVHARLVKDARRDEELYRRLNELNHQARFGRFLEEDGGVFGAVDVFARPFVVEHVVRACKVVGELWEDQHEKLQAELGAPPLLGEQPAPALRN
jgi:hypothetical protein